MRLISILKTAFTACLGLVALSGAAQSNHTVTFSGNSSDFFAAEKYTAQGAGMNTDYYITYDANNIYIGAFRTGGSTFGGADNLAVYIDTDPNATPTAGTGTTTGQNYNSVTGTLPFSANYAAHVEQSYQEMKTGTTWATAVTGFSVWTNTTTREISIPRSSIGNPDAVYITMWMGYNGGFFANAPGANIGASGNPTITGYVGGIGLYSADCIPINTINLPITASITNSVPAAGATYGRVIVNTGTVTNANSWTLAPGGAISVSGGTFAIGAQTITMGSAATANGKGTTINTSGAGAITTTASSIFEIGGEGYVTGNNLGLTANVRIRNKFTGLASGGLTINSGGSLDIRAGGYVNANPPTYAAGSTLMYNTGAAYGASTEWTAGAASGVGVPSNVTIGNSVTATTLNFGASTSYRQLNGNMTISASNTLALSTAVGGDLQIGGNMVNAGTFTHNSRGVTFNGTAAQSANSAAITYAYLTIANTAATVSTGAALTVVNNLTVNASARLNIGTNNFTLTGATSAINGFLRIGGATVPTLTGLSTTTLTFTSTGTYEHNYSINGATTIPTATWNSGSTCAVIGFTNATAAPAGLGQTFSNFTWNCPSQTATMNLTGALTTINGNFSVLSTGTGILRWGTQVTATVGGNLIITSNGTNSTLQTNNSGTASTINVGGNFIITQTTNVATFAHNGSSTTTVNFNRATASPVQVFSSNGTISGPISWNVGTGVTTNIVQLGSNVALGTGTGTFTVANNGTLDFQTYVLSGSGTFAAATGSTLQTAHLSGILSTTNVGSVQTTTRTFTNTGVKYIYNGAAAQVTGTAIAAAASIANLTINNASNVTLSASVPSLTGVLTFTSGKLSLSTFDLVMGSSATVSGASSSAYVLTGSTGQMKRSALGAAFTFPVGNSAYNPLTLTNSGTADVYGVRVVDGAVANANIAALAVNRAWVLTEAVAGGSTLSAVAQYNTGEEGASFAGGTTPYIGFWNNAGPWTQVGATLAGANPFTGTSSSTFAPTDLTTGTKYIAVGKDAAFTAPSTSYVWNGGTSSDWGTATNWTPNGVPGSVDNVTISVPGTNTLSINSARSITNFTVSGTGTFTTTSAGTLTITGTLVSSTSASVSLDCASTVSISSSTSQPIPAWNFGNLNTTGGARVLASSGTIGICGTFTPGAGALTITGSTVDFNGTGAQTVNAINYNNLTISGARGAATVTLTGGTIGVAGTFNPSATSVSYTNTGNTVDFNGTSTQTVAAFPSYNNLTISGARGAATVTLASGTIGVAGTFSPLATAVTYASTGNTFDYTSASPQTITAFNRYEHLSNSGNGARTLGAGTININGTYTPTTAAVTVGTGTVNFTNSFSQPIPASLYYNITNTGNGDRVWANSGTIDVANVFIAGTGTHTITGSTVRYSSTGAGPYALSVINTNVAGSSYNNLIIAGSNATPTQFNIAGATYGVAGNMTITGGHFYVASSFLPGTLNIYGNLTIAGGTLVVNASPTVTELGIVNIYGNYSMTSGTLARNTNVQNGFVNFLKASGTQTFSHTSGTYSIGLGFGVTVNIGDGSTTNTLQMLTNISSNLRFNVLANASIDLGTNVISNGSFTLNASGTLITAHAQGISASGASGSLQSMTPTLSTTGNYVYNGTVAQATGTGLTGANNLTINNTSGATPAVTLTSSATVSNVLTLTSGIVQLGTNNLTISNAATSAISGASSTRYIQTNSTGELRRAINGGIGSSTTYNFPVGTGSDYSPANYTFTATGNAFTLHTRAVGAAHPSLNSSAFQSDYISRYWVSNTSGTPSTYSYTNAFTFVAGDQTGSAASMFLNKWAGVWIQDATSSASGLVLSSGPTAFTESTNSLAATAEWTGRFEPIVTTYTWTGNVDNTWSDPNNWSPNTSVAGPVSTDNIIINAPGSVANLNITGSQSIASVTFNGTGSFSLASGASFTINGAVTYGGSFSASLNCNSTITYNNTAALTIPPFAYGNLANANASTRTWAAGATTGICGTLTTGTGSTFTAGAGSTVNYNGSGAQTIQPLSYANLSISNNRGAAVVTTPAGTIGVSGTFDISTYATSTTPSATVATGSIFDFTGAGAQTIPAFYYGQLNNTGNGARTLASSGIIDIAQGFTPTTGTTTITGSTVRYSDVTAGTWNLTNFTSNVAGRQYNNLIFVGGASTAWQPGTAFNLGVAGDLTLSGLGQVNVSPLATAVTWTVDGNLTINGGGTLSVARGTAAAAAGTLNVTGNTTVSNGSLVISGTGAAASVVGTMSTNNLTISGTGSIVLDVANTSSTGSVTVNGDMTVTSTSANCVNLGSGTNNAGNVFNLKGDFSKSGTGNIGFTGTYGATSGFNFNGTGTQTYTHSGAATTGGFITVASGSTLQLLSNLTMGISTSPLTVIGTLDCGAFVAAASLSTNTFAITATGTIRTANAGGISASISGYNNANTTWTAASTYVFTGSTQSTGLAGYAAISSTTAYNMTWLGSTSLSLDKAVTLTNLNFTNAGYIQLGNFNMTITSAGAINGSSFSSTKMIVTDGTGTLLRGLNALVGIPFTWPIGELTGTAEYSPVTISNIASNSSATASIGFRVVDGVQSNMSPAVSYLSRYWNYTANTLTAGTNWSNATFTYDASDIVVGPEASLKVNAYDATSLAWTQFASSSAASNVLTFTSGATTATLLSGNDITGRIDVPVYYRSVTTGTWANPSTWEISTDPTFTSPAGVGASVAPNAANSAGIEVLNGHTVTVGATTNADQVTINSGGIVSVSTGTFTIANGTGTDLTVASGGTLQTTAVVTLVISASATVQVNGLFKVSTAVPTITTTGALTIGATGTYEHNVNAGSIATATWTAGATCYVHNLTSNMPSGLGQAFYHVTIDCPTLLAAGLQTSGALQTVNGNLTLLSTGAGFLRLSAGTSYTLNVGGNIDIQNSQLDFSSGGGTSTVNVTGNVLMSGTSILQKTSTATITFNVNGDFIQSAGTFDVNNGSSGGGMTVNFKGNVTMNGVVQRSNGGTYTFNFVKASGTQTLSQGTPITTAQAIVWVVGNGTTTNTVQMLTDVNVGTSGTTTFTVNNAATLDFQDKTLLGSNCPFTMGASATLKMGSPYGITNLVATSASVANPIGGNLQTILATRVVNAAGTFIYNGTVNQVTGNLLPTTITGKLGVANTGTSGNNVVTLTTTPSTTAQLNLISGLFAAGAAGQLNISAAGTVNGTGGDFETGANAGILNFPSTGTFTGSCNPYNVYTSGGVNFGTGTVTIQPNGTFRINAGGFVATNAPFYASGSTLQYYSTGVYGRGLEWKASSGRAFPHHVRISNNTTLNPTANSNASFPESTGGDLTIDAGSALYNDYGGVNMALPLIVGGGVNLAGSLSLSGQIGSNCHLNGNWMNTGSGSNFFCNARSVKFLGSSNQNIGGTNTGSNPFDNIVVDNLAGVTLTGYDIYVNNTVLLTNGNLTLGNYNLTMASGAVVSNPSSTRFIVTNGTGQLIQYFAAISRQYPVGPDATTYAPVTLKQNGTADNIGVRVVTAPAFAGTLNDATKMVNLQWLLNEATAGGNALTSTFEWPASSEAAAFDRTMAVFHGNYNGTAWQVRPSSATTGTDPYESLSTVDLTGTLSNTAFAIGNFEGFLPCLTTLAAGNWNDGAIWLGGSEPVAGSRACVLHSVVVTDDTNPMSGVTVSSAGTLTVNSGWDLNFDNNGLLVNNTGSTASLGAGNVVFTGDGVVSGSNPFSLNNLELNGTISLTTAPIVNGKLQMFSGAVVTTNAPVYTGSSILEYTTGSSITPTLEWSANGTTAGAGIPANVNVVSSTTVNMPASNRGIAGSLNITSGALNLNATSGDLYLTGNWTRGAAATFASNNRAVFFNGSANQTIAVTGGGTETFSYLLSNKSGGSLVLSNSPATNVDVTANSGNVFEMGTSNTLDLNGQTFSLTGTGGNFNITGGAVTVTGAAGSLFAISNGTKTVSHSGGATLGFGTNVKVALNSGMNFGSNISTINGTLQIALGGFVTGNAPFYGSASTLHYFTGNYYNRGIEWSTNSGAGYPNHVMVSQNGTVTTVDLSPGASACQTAGDLTINDGAAVTMGSMSNPLIVLGNATIGNGTSGALTLSSNTGGDAKFAGNLTVNTSATLTQNSREVEMNGTAVQNIYGVSTFDYLSINNSGASVKINSAANINNRIRLVNGLFDVNGYSCTMANNSKVVRLNGTISTSPIVSSGDMYDMEYQASVTSSVEFNSANNVIRDLIITTGNTLTLGANRTFNRDLSLNGGDLNLGTFTLTGRGRATAPSFSGSINVSGGGTRTITGSTGAQFDITGLGANLPNDYTKTVSTFGGTLLNFDANVLVRIGDGSVDFGAGSPTTINGTLQVLLGGSVGQILNPCYYGVNSLLRFANTVDYQVGANDKTWAAGSIASGNPGIPYNVEILDAGTDLQLQDTRALRGNLTMTNGTFTLTPAYSGSFNLGGNWTRTGVSSAFTHNNKKVVFDRQSAGDQTITVGSGVITEIFYDLEVSTLSGNLVYGSSTSVAVRNNLNFVSGNINLNGANFLTIGSFASDGTITGVTSSRYVIGSGGTVRRYTGNNSTNYDFPLGDATSYSPFQLNLTNGGQSGAYIDAILYSTVHPNMDLLTTTDRINRYWKIEPSGLAASPVYNVVYSYAASDVVGSSTNFRPVKYSTTNPGNGWLSDPGSSAPYVDGTAGSHNAGSRTFTWSGITTFSEFSGAGNGSPLPIELLSFNATAATNSVVLDWVTTSEINNASFHLERSIDLENIETIGQVAGAGNSNTTLNYNFIDSAPKMGVSYYRLRQTDFNGTVDYSEWAPVVFSSNSTSLNYGYFYSNKGESSLSFGITNTAPVSSLEVIDATGRVVLTEVFETRNSTTAKTLSMPELANGVYFLRVISGGQQVIRKFGW